MKKLIYISVLMALFACDELYHADLDLKENYLSIEAVLTSDDTIHQVKIYETLGLYDGVDYPMVSGANVVLQSIENQEFAFEEIEAGIYRLDYDIDQGLKYTLSVEYDGNSYLSSIQTVPEKPQLDSLSGRIEYLYQSYGASSESDDLYSIRGVRLFADIMNENTVKYYRFSGKKVFQYATGTEAHPNIYLWKTLPLDELYFNITGPSDYSATDIILQHPMEFFGETDGMLPSEEDMTYVFTGWIYFIQQYGITEESYVYYSEINKQLQSEGQIYDPVYVQPISNIVCVNDPSVRVVGNFEIQSHTEYRFYLLYYNVGDYLFLKNIPYFYDIPESGISIDIKPDFYESPLKTYP